MPPTHKTAKKFASMVPDGYIPRIVDTQIERYLQVFGAIEITGAKWCGKTWAASAHANSIIYLDEGNNAVLAADDPELVLEGMYPRVIDEWQQVPQLWNAVRHAVDKKRKLRGAWILTGSSTPSVTENFHSGAGRIGRIRMFPMTLAETNDSSKVVSLAGLFRGEFKKTTASNDTDSLIDLCCRGGWPEAIDDSVADAQIVAREYLRSVYEQAAPAQGKSASTTEHLLRSLARTLGQSATKKTVLADMENSSGESLTENTYAKYFDFLRRIFLVQEMPGWVPAIRSPKRLRMKPKHYFADPSLAVAALGMSPAHLKEDWQTFGFIYENLCVRDLTVYAGALPDVGSPVLRYYKDDTGLEADAIIERADGSWAAFEFKVSEAKLDETVANLTRLKKKLTANRAARVKPPVFMAVITGNGQFAREVKEGIYAIPLRALTV